MSLLASTTSTMGNYHSVEDMAKSPVNITYLRGYGNLIKHTLNPDGSLTTSAIPWNRLQPMTAPFGGEVLPRVAPGDIPQFDSQTNIAWLPPGLAVSTPSPMRQARGPSMMSAAMPTQY